MADSPPDADTGVGSDREVSPGTPRWVKVFGIIAVLVVLLFVVLRFVLPGDHGPGRHGRGGDTPSSLVTEDGRHRPPVAHRP